MINYNLKHIDDLVIGDEIVIHIPTVMDYVGTVTFINRDLNFIFIDGDVDDEDEIGIQYLPNEDGYFKVPVIRS